MNSHYIDTLDLSAWERDALEDDIEDAWVQLRAIKRTGDALLIPTCRNIISRLVEDRAAILRRRGAR